MINIDDKESSRKRPFEEADHNDHNTDVFPDDKDDEGDENDLDKNELGAPMTFNDNYVVSAVSAAAAASSKTSNSDKDDPNSDEEKDEKLKRRMEVNRLRAKEIRKRKKKMIEEMHNQIFELTLENNKLRTQTEVQQAQIEILRQSLANVNGDVLATGNLNDMQLQQQTQQNQLQHLLNHQQQLNNFTNQAQQKYAAQIPGINGLPHVSPQNLHSQNGLGMLRAGNLQDTTTQLPGMGLPPNIQGFSHLQSQNGNIQNAFNNMLSGGDVSLPQGLPSSGLKNNISATGAAMANSNYLHHGAIPSGLSRSIPPQPRHGDYFQQNEGSAFFSPFVQNNGTNNQQQAISSMSGGNGNLSGATLGSGLINQFQQGASMDQQFESHQLANLLANVPPQMKANLFKSMQSDQSVSMAFLEQQRQALNGSSRESSKSTEI